MIKSKHKICIKCGKIKSWTKTPTVCRQCKDEISRNITNQFYTECPGCGKKTYFKHASGVSRAKKKGASHCQICKTYKPIANIYGITVKSIIDAIPKYKKYHDDVRRLTKKQPIYTLENYDKRGKYGYHLDHIKSIYYGFINDIPAETIANINNLQMLWWIDNLRKSAK